MKAKASFKPGQEVVLFLPVQLKTSVAAAKKGTSIAKNTTTSTTRAKASGKRAVMAKERPGTTTAKKKEPVRKLAQADVPAKVRR